MTMNLPDLLNVAIGLVLLFFLLSTIASLAVEILTQVTHYREEILQVTVHRLLLNQLDRPWNIRKLLWDRFAAQAIPDFAWLQGTKRRLRPAADYDRYTKVPGGKEILRGFWEHPKIRSLVSGEAQAPASLSSDVFAQVLVDLVIPKNAQGELPDNRLALDRALALPRADVPDKLRFTLRTMTQTTEIPTSATGDELWKAYRAAVGAWYDEAVNRATETYRLLMKRLLLSTGLLLAVLLNADALRVIKVLSQDSGLSASVARYAEELSKANEKAGAGQETGQPADPKELISQQAEHLRELESRGFPIGWKGKGWDRIMAGRDEDDPGPAGQASLTIPDTVDERRARIAAILLLKVFGFIATGLAVAQGGPFWYDLMQKLIGLRKGSGGGEAADASAKAKPAGTVAADGKGKLVPKSPLPLEIGHDLASPALGFSARKAYWLASASAAAYLGKEEVEKLASKNWHFRVCKFLDIRGAQAFFAADDKLIVVAFRGTETEDVRDILVDANIKFEALRPDPAAKPPAVPHQVHSGFLSSFVSLQEQLTALLEGELAAGERQVYLTGHSLGGALATVMFARLTACCEATSKEFPDWRLSVKVPVPTLYTFGCPKVGNGEFAQRLDRRFPERIFRLENHVDIVPELPPLPAFSHAGRRMYFDAEGKMARDPSVFSRLMSEVECSLGQRSLKDAVGAKISAHGVAHYVERCERLAKSIA